MYLKNNVLKKSPSDFIKALHDILEKTIYNMYIDYDSIVNKRYDNNPYCVDECRIGSSGEWIYDEDEVYNRQLDRLKVCIESDGWGEYLPIEGTRWFDECVKNTKAYNRVQDLILKILYNDF